MIASQVERCNIDCCGEIQDSKFETTGGHSSVNNDRHEPVSGILSLLNDICLVGHDFN